MRYLTVVLLLGLGACDEVSPKFSAAKRDDIRQVPLATVQAVPESVLVVQDNKHLKVVAATATPATFKTVRVLVTAYCPCSRCCGRMTGKTSTGGNAWRTGVAADPTWLPYGTRVAIEGYGETIVDDTGAAMKKRRWIAGVPRMDVRMNYHHDARQWGAQYLDVRVFH